MRPFCAVLRLRLCGGIQKAPAPQRVGLVQPRPARRYAPAGPLPQQAPGCLFPLAPPAQGRGPSVSKGVEACRKKGYNKAGRCDGFCSPSRAENGTRRGNT
ncbi:hypothetical protein D3Z52_00025 [Clostridiaceae bacterium]|nr:hypothetical protein [Clostridiaceae bacterium]